MWRSSSPTRKRIRRQGASRVRPIDYNADIVAKRDLVTWARGHWFMGWIFLKTVLVRPELHRARIGKTLTRQHSSTDKHGRRDQAGTAVRTAHKAEPAARRFFREPRGYFSADEPAALATRVSAYRLADGHPQRPCVSYPDGPSCRAVSAPDADPPRRFNALDPSSKSPNSRCAFWIFFARAALRSEIPSPSIWTLTTGGLGPPTFTTTTATRALRLAPPSPLRQPPARREPVRRGSIDLRRHGGARAPSGPRRSAFALSGERRAGSVSTRAAGEGKGGGDGPTVPERHGARPRVKLRYHNHL